MWRFYFGCLVVFSLLGATVHPVFGLNCGETCGGTKGTDCSDCCVNYGSACTSLCTGSPKTCKYTPYNSCTDWVDNGECINFCQNQICRAGNPSDMQIISCGGGTCGSASDGGGSEVCSPGAPSLQSPANGSEWDAGMTTTFHWHQPMKSKTWYDNCEKCGDDNHGGCETCSDNIPNWGCESGQDLPPREYMLCISRSSNKNYICGAGAFMTKTYKAGDSPIFDTTKAPITINSTGKFYWTVRAKNKKSLWTLKSSLQVWSFTVYATSTCTLDLGAASLSIEQGKSVNLVANITSSVGINRIDYSTDTTEHVNPVCTYAWTSEQCQSHMGCIYMSGGCRSQPYSRTMSDAISLNPISDNSSPYQTQVTGVNPNNQPEKTTTITGSVYLGSSTTATCTKTINVTVTPGTPPAVAWWQGKDTDIIANGSIRSYVPSTYKFILDGLGTFPGVAVYGKVNSLTLPIIGAFLSSTNWKAQTDTNLSGYRFASFNKKTTGVVFNPCPSDLSSIAGSHTNADPQGYVWYKCQGTDLNLATGTANITDNKIVIMVDGGNVNLKTKVNLTKGQGFFGLFTNGDINIYKSVGGSLTYDLEGIYFADGKVNTAYDIGADPTTSSLKFRGSVVGMGGVSLQRDLGSAINKTSPAEFFEYAPDQLFLLPSAFSTKKTHWQEIAP